jgi:hypothetical protein
MQRLCRIRLAVVAAALVFAGACQSPDQPELRGSLYFGAGQYLAELDLRDGSTSVVANIGDVEVREISPQRDERLLLSVLGTVNQQATHELVLYDPPSRQTLTLTKGRHGRYLPGTDTLVYDDGLNIVVAERGDEDRTRTRIQAHAFNAAVSILPISASRFLYTVADGPIMSWDALTRQANELVALSRVCDLERALWIPDHEQLLCAHREEDGAIRQVLFGLDGEVEGMLSLPAAKLFRPVAWLPDQRVLVLTEQWRSWFSGSRKSAIWVYRLDDRRTYRLVDDQYLGESVVYRPVAAF